MKIDDRLDSWKEIAAYLRRGVRTAQRWERVAGLPVRRVASERGAVYAFRSELDAWWLTQSDDARHGALDEPALQRAVSQAVVSELRAPVHSSRERPTVESKAPMAAHGSMRVREFLSHAIAIDPEFALGHANLAVYFFTLVAMGLLRPAEGMPAARAAARRASDLDGSIPDAQVLLAIVSSLFDHDWVEADRRFTIAFGREPVAPSVRFHYAIWHLSPLGYHADALVQLQRGLIDDPLYLLGRVQVGMELCSLGRFSDGVAELEQVLKIDPRFGPALGLLGRERAIRGHVDEALGLAERTYAAIPRHPNAAGFLAAMLHRTGYASRSRAVLESLQHDNAWAIHRARAEFHVVCGELDAAFESTTAAVEERDPGVWLLFAGTAGNLLRSAPQWSSLRARLNLPHGSHARALGERAREATLPKPRG